MKWKIPLFKTYWEKDDIDAITRVIKRGTYWATGPEIDEFEKRIAEFVGTNYCVSFNSGTSALHAVLLAYGLTSGEIIVPSFTFISTANAVRLAGATPIFAESESESYGLDAEDVERKITKYTRAIIPIHYGGLVSRDIIKLKKLAKENNIFLLEDAAESLGSSLRNINVGTFGDAAMFSFCQNKVITMGEGGVIVTNSEEIYHKLRLIRSHGRYECTTGDYFSTTAQLDYIQIGYNFRLPTMSAALGISQLNKIQKAITMRRRHATYINKELSQFFQLRLPLAFRNSYHVYQMYTIQLQSQSDRDALQHHLTHQGIMSKVYFDPVHLTTFYRKSYGYKEGDLPQTEIFSKKVLTLPMFPSLTRKEVNFIIESISTFLRG